VFPRLNEIFRETIELIKAMFDVLRRLQRDFVRYLAAAITIRRFVEQFMTAHGVPGVSLAIAYKGRLVFRKGYGFADTSTKEPLTTSHLFRIASLSKAITATAVFKLLEERRLSTEVGQGWTPALRLDEKVFGQGGILGTTYGTPPPGSGVDQITVQHLLEHTSGWDKNGQGNNPPDPMFDPSHLNDTQDQLITWMVQQPIVDSAPGTYFRYLNFGYLVLGRVIEARSGMSYADYVRQVVLTPCGISDMHIAGNTLADRRPNEVHYYPGPKSPYNPYALLVDRMDAHGGWIASPTDLLRFLVRVDSFASPPDILTSSSILTMVTPTSATRPPSTPGGIGGPANYAKGWGVHTVVAAGKDNYWHEGNLAGTEAFFIRTTDQYCFAVLANSRDDATDADWLQMMADIDKLWWDIKNGVEGGYDPGRVWPTGTAL
jgi:CubicO group peptidase (beta-lactamase class C family)